jgi:hypothetical protein
MVAASVSEEAEPSGLLVSTMALPLDGERLEELVGLILRGLMFHHWGVVLGPDKNVDVLRPQAIIRQRPLQRLGSIPRCGIHKSRCLG